jgi:hypothetical protein
MSRFGGLRWRYHNYVEPLRTIHRGPYAYFSRWHANRGAAALAQPNAYVCADPTNSGDYTSHLGVRQLVNRPGVELYCAPAALKETTRTLMNPPRPNGQWQVVWVGGGGLFQSCFDPFWSRLLQSRVPFVVFGVGANQAGDYRSATPPELLRSIAENALAIHVRDRFTQQLFAPYYDGPVTVGICPSVNYLTEVARNLPRQATHLLHVVHNADVAMAGVSAADLRSVLRGLAGQLDLVYDETNHLVGLRHRLLRRYTRAALVVSSRLHGCIFSYALAKPFLALAFDRKVDAFLETHVPNNPCLAGDQALARLSANLLTEVAQRPPAADQAIKAAENVAAMRYIMQSLPD